MSDGSEQQQHLSIKVTDLGDNEVYFKVKQTTLVRPVREKKQGESRDSVLETTLAFLRTGDEHIACLFSPTQGHGLLTVQLNHYVYMCVVWPSHQRLLCESGCRKRLGPLDVQWPTHSAHTHAGGAEDGGRGRD